MLIVKTLVADSLNGFAPWHGQTQNKKGMIMQRLFSIPDVELTVPCTHTCIYIYIHIPSGYLTVRHGIDGP